MGRASSDIETAVDGPIVHPRQQVAASKKTMWQSLRANPKVVFIAFFAS
jgi:hypothetical protein